MGATGALISFCTLCKSCYKMQTCTLIASIFGTNEEHVTVDSCCESEEYSKSYECLVMLKILNFCHGYRINRE